MQYCSKKCFSVIGASLFLVLSLSFWAIVPPFQSPDEFEHVDAAVAAVKGDWIPTSDGRYTSVDKNLLLYQGYYQSLLFKTYNKVDMYSQLKAESLLWSGENKSVSLAGATSYPPTFYFVQGIGLQIGKLLGLSIHQSYQLARFLNILVTAVSFLILIRLFEPLRLGTLFLAISPMFAFQAASCSPDSQFTLAALLAAGFCLKVMEQSKPLISRDFLIATGLTVLVAMMKPPYIALFGLLVASLFQHRARAIQQVIVLIIALCLVMLWIRLGSLSFAIFEQTPGVDTHAQVSYVLSNPFAFLGVLYKTFSAYGHIYLITLFGVLGWLDTPLPIIAYKLGLIGFLAIFIAQGLIGPSLRLSLRLPIVLVICTVVVLVLASIYVISNPVAASQVTRVQGRYFMPLVPLFIAAAGGWGLPVNGSLLRVSALSLLIIGILSTLVATVFGLKAVVDRYYIPVPKFDLEFVTDVKSYPLKGWVDKVTVEQDGSKITISGWADVETEDASLLLTLDSGLVKSAKAFRVERPDVVKATHNDNLRLSGFILMLEISKGGEQFLKGLCVGSRDHKEGVYRLNVAPGSEICK